MPGKLLLHSRGTTLNHSVSLARAKILARPIFHATWQCLNTNMALIQTPMTPRACHV